jgi:hypothetical protein
MKLKSETSQVLEFLKSRFEIDQQNKKVADRCKELNLNYDMVQRALLLLQKSGLIARDSRGPKSYYLYPTEIGVGDIINAIQGINLGDLNLNKEVIKTLNGRLV